MDEKIKISAFQEWVEDFIYDVRCSPRRTKYWFLTKFTKTKVKIETLHGGWYDTDSKILHVNFQLLVNFMEKEVAHMYDVCLENYEPAKKQFPNPPKTNREKAEAYYTYEEDTSGMTAQELKHHKAQKAWEHKVLALYRWWKDERPARKDKWDELVAWEKETGFEPWHFEPASNNCSTMVSHDDHPLWPKYKQLQDEAHKQEEEWEKEDTKKLIELIKLRHRLWT